MPNDENEFRLTGVVTDLKFTDKSKENTSLLMIDFRLIWEGTNQKKENLRFEVYCKLWRRADSRLRVGMHNGDKVSVVGKLLTETYEKDGEVRKYSYLQVYEISVPYESFLEQTMETMGSTLEQIQRNLIKQQTETTHEEYHEGD